MLHPTNLPACTPTMEQILDFQEHLLDFACRCDVYSQDDLVAEFGKDIAKWLHENRMQVLDPLKKFISAASQAEKISILEEFKHDRIFISFVDDPAFTFAFVVEDSSPEYVKEIRRWLIGYYKQLSTTGFPIQICNTGGENFTQHQWWTGYQTANPGANTCAVCDASLSAGGRTIEHFFPKSRYPALSIHPENLLPLCKTCNNDVKKEKDPLANNLITAIFLPYHRYIRSEGRLDFQDDGQGGYVVSLEPANTNPTTKDRIRNFDSLFELSRRWSQVMGDISENAFRQARDYIEVMLENGKVVDAETIPTFVDAVCVRMEKSWGKSNFSFVSTEWLRWAKVHKPALLKSLASV